MLKNSQTKKLFYFSTRDLLVMAVLAALGGVTSTYVNTLSDVVHAALGFAGASQWAAGLHVIWIVLAMGILRKLGVGTLTGIIKGAVELMSGNSHGVIILLIDMIAGLFVDLGFVFFPKKRHLLPYLISGGVATASNVLVFQLFATLPQNILGITAIIILFIVAMASGLVFAGILPYILVNTLVRAGVVKLPEDTIHKPKIIQLILVGFLLITFLSAIFLKINLQGPQAVEISGAAVNKTYEFPSKKISLETVSRKINYRGVLTEYQGYPLIDIIQYAEPDPNADTLLIKASDGYAFLISFEELQSNPNILLVQQGRGKNASFDVVGPESSKAWVRNVSQLTVIKSKCLSIISSSGEINQFDPDNWLAEMDSTQIALPKGSQKLQGVPVYKVVEANINETQTGTITFQSESGSLQINWSEIAGNDNLRIFTIIEENSIAFALADMSGEVLIYPLTEVEIDG